MTSQITASTTKSLIVLWLHRLMLGGCDHICKLRLDHLVQTLHSFGRYLPPVEMEKLLAPLLALLPTPVLEEKETVAKQQQQHQQEERAESKAPDSPLPQQQSPRPQITPEEMKDLEMQLEKKTHE